MKSGKVSEEITFDPVPLGIKGADFWEELNKEKTDQKIIALDKNGSQF